MYGADHQTRRLVEAHGRGYVLAVTAAQRLGLKPVEDWLEDVPARSWKRPSSGLVPAGIPDGPKRYSRPAPGR